MKRSPLLFSLYNTLYRKKDGLYCWLTHNWIKRLMYVHFNYRKNWVWKSSSHSRKYRSKYTQYGSKIELKLRALLKVGISKIIYHYASRIYFVQIIWQIFNCGNGPKSGHYLNFQISCAGNSSNLPWEMEKL